MRIVHINSWQEFEKVVSGLDGWAFRGQKNSSWQLWSSLSRQMLKFSPNNKNEWPEREERSVRIFQRKAHNYLNEPQILENELRCLALMQHHGAPTRLIDFTKSPYVAAFFALEDTIEDAAVYAINTPYLWYAVPEFNSQLNREQIDPRQAGNLSKYFIQQDLPIVWTGEPGKLDRRLLAQSGTFVLPGVLDRSVDDILDSHYPASEPILHKFILPFEMREQAMLNLYRMNITYATLFPDLDGLARASALELEMMWKGLVAYPKLQEN